MYNLIVEIPSLKGIFFFFLDKNFQKPTLCVKLKGRVLPANHMNYAFKKVSIIVITGVQYNFELFNRLWDVSLTWASPLLASFYRWFRPRFWGKSICKIMKRFWTDTSQTCKINSNTNYITLTTLNRQWRRVTLNFFLLRHFSN